MVDNIFNKIDNNVTNLRLIDNVVQINRENYETYQLNNNNFKYFVKAMKENKSITNISFDDKVDERMIEFLINILKINTTIQYITFENYTNKFIKYLCDVMKENKTVRNLYIYSKTYLIENKTNEEKKAELEMIIYISEMLKINKILKTLVFDKY